MAQNKTKQNKNPTIGSSLVKHKTLWVKYKEVNSLSNSSALLQNTQSFFFQTAEIFHVHS